MNESDNPGYIAARGVAFTYARLEAEAIHFWTVRENGLEYKHYALPCQIVSIVASDPLL